MGTVTTIPTSRAMHPSNYRTADMIDTVRKVAGSKVPCFNAQPSQRSAIVNDDGIPVPQWRDDIPGPLYGKCVYCGDTIVCRDRSADWAHVPEYRKVPS